MKINQHTRIDGEVCTLVPYMASMVETYHNWMQDEYNLKMTCSEPLTIEEEYEMCKSWREDDNKLTFIVLDKSLSDNEGLEEICKGGGRMCGDVNLFEKGLEFFYIAHEK